MKNLILSTLTFVALTFIGCSSDDDNNSNNNNDDNNNPTVPTVNVTGAITGTVNWTADNIYIMNQKVVVENGATLNIAPGTIIKGTEGTGSLASALVVARGGTLNANGTASQPIIFTSILDNITIGQTAGTNLTSADNGKWGGLIILGNAPCSFSGDVVELQIEGIPADDAYGLYGGTNPSDSSGSLRYISIRHGGALIGQDNEINGLTLGGVGTGTTIDHIEVVANQDDGIEFFGGTVNASNLVVWAQGDDGLDVDQAYSGTITNAVVALGANSDHAFEIDGPEGSATGSYTINGATIVGDSTTDRGEYADYRKGATGANNNVYAYGFKIDSDIELDADADATSYNNGDLTFSNWEIVLPAGVTDVTSLFVNKANTVTVTGFGSEATAVTEGSQTVGADTSVFAWTFAAANSAF